MDVRWDEEKSTISDTFLWVTTDPQVLLKKVNHLSATGKHPQKENKLAVGGSLMKDSLQAHSSLMTRKRHQHM